MTEPTDVEFRPLTIPASMDASDADEFREFTRVRNAVYREISGRDDDALQPEELLPHYQPDPAEIRHIWVVLDGDEIMAVLGIRPGREVGEAYRFLLDLRMDRGPLDEASATEALKAFWAARPSSQ